MNEEEYRKLTEKEAFATIGLHPKDESTYYLANLIVRVIESGLQITSLSKLESTEPETTFETESPFVFTYHGAEYLLKPDDGKLSVFKKISFQEMSLNDQNP